MTQKVGRQSHRGVYRKTDEISTNAAAAIGKWRFVTEIHRQTACVKFTRDERTFYWHPVAKKFRREGEAAWSHLPSGRGVVALMLHLHGKEELYGIPHYGAMCDPPISRPAAAGSASPPSFQAGESHSEAGSRAEISRVASRRDLDAEAEVMGYEGMQR